MKSLSTLPTLRTCKKGCPEIAISHDGLCAKCAGTRPLRDYSDRPEPRSESLPLIGAELEYVGSKQGRYDVSPLARFVCYDGSVDNGGEVKLLGNDATIAKRVADVCQRARINHCEPSRKCGYHVHLGYAHRFQFRGGEFLRKGESGWWERIAGGTYRLVSSIEAIEEEVFELMPQSRRDNQYCQRIADAGLRNHYSWASLSGRVPTIEIRIHGSTVNPWKAAAWVQVCAFLRNYFFDRIEGTRTIAGELSEIVPKDTLASRYLAEREKAGGSLERFVF